MRFGRKGKYPTLSSSTSLFLSTPIDRASIEEDYGKRLAKLAQMTLGQDEAGYAFCLCFLPILYTLNWGRQSVTMRWSHRQEESITCHSY